MEVWKSSTVLVRFGALNTVEGGERTALLDLFLCSSSSSDF